MIRDVFPTWARKERGNVGAARSSTHPASAAVPGPTPQGPAEARTAARNRCHRPQHRGDRSTRSQSLGRPGRFSPPAPLSALTLPQQQDPHVPLHGGTAAAPGVAAAASAASGGNQRVVRDRAALPSTAPPAGRRYYPRVSSCFISQKNIYRERAANRVINKQHSTAVPERPTTRRRGCGLAGGLSRGLAYSRSPAHSEATPPQAPSSSQTRTALCEAVSKRRPAGAKRQRWTASS